MQNDILTETCASYVLQKYLHSLQLSIVNFTLCRSTDAENELLFLPPSSLPLCFNPLTHVYPTHAFNRHIPLFHPLTISHSFAPDLPRCLTASLHPSPVILFPLALLTSSPPPGPLFIIPYNSYIHSHLIFNPLFGSVRPSRCQSASPFFSSTEPREGNGASLCSPVRTLRGCFSAAPGADRPDHEEQPAGDASGPGSAVWTAAGQ